MKLYMIAIHVIDNIKAHGITWITTIETSKQHITLQLDIVQHTDSSQTLFDLLKRRYSFNVHAYSLSHN